MPYTTLIGVAEAVPHRDDPDWLFVDCRHALGQPDAGRAAYRAAHVAGAVFADLDTDLSGPVVPGRTGRHPLPAEAAFEATAGRLGIGPGTQVVAYDASSGAMAAARLWWLLRWAGHDAVAVLDGGLAAWTAAGLPVASGDEERPPAAFTGRFGRMPVATTDELPDGRILVDARAADRFRGENETVDPVAGHIPGARSLPYAGNVTSAGTFETPATLRQRFAELGSGEKVFYCGSGVTAAHHVLAHEHAGLGAAALYPGSWSEWITDEDRPVER